MLSFDETKSDLEMVAKAYSIITAAIAAGQTWIRIEHESVDIEYSESFANMLVDSMLHEYTISYDTHNGRVFAA